MPDDLLNLPELFDLRNPIRRLEHPLQAEPHPKDRRYGPRKERQKVKEREQPLHVAREWRARAARAPSREASREPADRHSGKGKERREPGPRPHGMHSEDRAVSAIRHSGWPCTHDRVPTS